MVQMTKAQVTAHMFASDEWKKIEEDAVIIRDYFAEAFTLHERLTEILKGTDNLLKIGELSLVAPASLRIAIAYVNNIARDNTHVENTKMVKANVPRLIISYWREVFSECYHIEEYASDNDIEIVG